VNTTTGGNSQVSTGDLEQTPLERETAPELSTRGESLQRSLVTLRARLLGALARSRGYWMPPRLLTDRPESVAELAAYARRGGYAAPHGVGRRLGLAWFYVVALPTTVVCRYVAWFAERPGRWLAAAFIWQTVIRSEPGIWAVDHIVRPVLAAAAWAFLP